MEGHHRLSTICYRRRWFGTSAHARPRPHTQRWQVCSRTIRSTPAGAGLARVCQHHTAICQGRVGWVGEETEGSAKTGSDPAACSFIPFRLCPHCDGWRVRWITVLASMERSGSGASSEQHGEAVPVLSRAGGGSARRLARSGNAGLTAVDSGELAIACRAGACVY